MSKDRLTNNIRRLRFDAGEMTQQQLADKVGVTRQTIIATEQGRYAPSLPLDPVPSSSSPSTSSLRPRPYRARTSSTRLSRRVSSSTRGGARR